VDDALAADDAPGLPALQARAAALPALPADGRLTVASVSPASVAPRAPAPSAPAGSGDAPILLLPDGFAFLATGERGASDSLHLGAAPLPALLPPALAPAAALLPAGTVRATPGAAPQGPAPVAAATDGATAQTAASHAYVSSPRLGAAQAALAAGAAVGLAALAGVALYHRIRPHAALENDTRKAIFDAVCTSPGLGVHVIAQKAGVSYSTATYHLERLVAAGMIVMTPDGNKLCYYKNGGAFTETERRILPLVKNDEAAKLLEAILDTPGTYRAALAERLGVTATTINWHLRRLREAGLIDEIRQGRNAYLTVRVAAARESFLSLAAKVEGTDAPVADRLRRFASVTDGGAGLVGPSGA
jgi:predicted transcriptional regulator